MSHVQTVAYQVIINSPVLLHAPIATMCLLNPISLTLMANRFLHAKKKTDVLVHVHILSVIVTLHV